MFSPIVRAPLTDWPGSWAGSKASYCAISFAARASNSSRSASVHQLFMLPRRSYFDPWSSKPWPISWPITAPMAP